MNEKNQRYAMKRTLDLAFDAADAQDEILGACSPPLALRALEADGDIGLLLPCNVVVQEGEEHGTLVVEALDPVVQLSLADSESLAPLAEEVRSRLVRVLDRIEQGAEQCT